MSSPTSPGWYADPEDALQLRYFDGVVWTRHTTPLQSPTAGSSTIGRAPDVQGVEERARQAATTNAPSWSAPPVWGTAPKGALPDGAVLAEWWRRLLARIIDWFVTSLVAGLLSIPFLGPLVTAFEEYFTDVLAGRTPDQSAFEAGLTEAVLPLTLISVAVGLLYETAFLVWKAATPGKMLLGTVVRPTGQAGGVSLVVALRRQAITVVTSLLGLHAVLGVVGTMLSIVDPAWLLWDPKRQALHDKVADTVVVLKR